MKKILLVITMIFTSVLFFACTNKVEVNNENENETETVEQLEKKEESDEIDLDRFINDVLFMHYDEQFGYTENLYKTVGYKILGKEAINDTELKVYVIANYMEYDEEENNVAGSGPAALALTINLKGIDSKVDYQVLTDSDIGSEKYNEAFPEDIRKKINPISEADKKEVIEKQEKMLKEQIAEENGEEIEEEIEEEEEEEEEMEEEMEE